MPPSMHESTKHPQRGRRPVSIDRHLKIYGSGIPDSMPFHEKYIARPQKKFSDRPLFQKGSPGAGREPCEKRRVAGREPFKKHRVQGEKPCKKHRVQGGKLCKKHRVQSGKPCKKHRVQGEKP